MAIISCPECNRQVSDKALKCPQCGYPIVNLEKPESVSLQVLQEKIQNVVSVNSLTVKVSPVGKSLNIKLTRTGIKILKPAYDQLWMKIRLQLNPDNLRGFNKLLIASNFEGDIKSEWERQNDIDSTGKLIRNKEDKSRLIIVSILILISGGLISAFIITFQMAGYNPFKSNFKSESPKTDISSTSSEILPPHTVKTTTFKSIGLTGEGGKVLVESNDPKLSRDDCIKLANKYKPVEGQVGVHKLTFKFNPSGEMIPFCVDNLDGKGIFFPFPDFW